MKPRLIYLVGLALALLLLAAPALANPQAFSPLAYDLSWSVIAGGGATFATAGSYSLGATIGQPLAGSLSASRSRLNAGFWVDAYPYSVYLPVIDK